MMAGAPIGGHRIFAPTGDDLTGVVNSAIGERMNPQ
jgi:hypothetical protein